jgi:hypothetical protein
MSFEEKIVDRLLKEAGISKSAKIFDVGDVVVMVDQVQGLNKGSLYKVTGNENPGQVTIAEYSQEKDGQEGVDGDVIGEYPADRFVRWNKES